MQSVVLIKIAVYKNIIILYELGTVTKVKILCTFVTVPNSNDTNIDLFYFNTNRIYLMSLLGYLLIER